MEPAIIGAAITATGMGIAAWIAQRYTSERHRTDMAVARRAHDEDRITELSKRVDELAKRVDQETAERRRVAGVLWQAVDYIRELLGWARAVESTHDPDALPLPPMPKLHDNLAPHVYPTWAPPGDE